jgi:hypothetical protein
MNLWIYEQPVIRDWMKSLHISYVYPNQYYAEVEGLSIYKAVECDPDEGDFFLVAYGDGHPGFCYETESKAAAVMNEWSELHDVKTNGRKFSEETYFIRYVKRGEKVQ